MKSDTEWWKLILYFKQIFGGTVIYGDNATLLGDNTFSQKFLSIY